MNFLIFSDFLKKIQNFFGFLWIYFSVCFLKIKENLFLFLDTNLAADAVTCAYMSPCDNECTCHLAHTSDCVCACVHVCEHVCACVISGLNILFKM